MVVIGVVGVGVVVAVMVLMVVVGLLGVGVPSQRWMEKKSYSQTKHNSTKKTFIKHPVTDQTLVLTPCPLSRVLRVFGI